MSTQPSRAVEPARPSGRAEPRAEPMDPEQLRAEIRRTRVELGETIEALAAKADVRARLTRSVADAPVPWVLAAVSVALFLAAVIAKRRRR